MADQTITFTRLSGTVGPENFTVTIQDGETPNNLENITDDEARAAITQARTAQAGVDLKNYDISTPDDSTTPATPAAFAHDRYEGLVNESAPPPPPPPADPLPRQRPLRLTLDIFGSDVTSGGAGGDLALTWRHPFSQHHAIDYGFGLGGRGLSLWGDPRSLDLTQSHIDTGVTSLTNADSWRFDVFARARYQWYFADRWFVGALVDAGLGIIPGQTTGHKPSGDAYQTSYCGDGNGSGGIFGNDQGTGGCTNRPLGTHAQPGADNSTRDGTTSVGLLTRFGPVFGWDVADRFNLALTGGGEAYLGFTGPVPSRLGWFAGALFTVPLGTPEPTMSSSPTAPEPPEPPAAAVTLTPVAESLTIGAGEGVRILPPAGQEWPAGAVVHIDGTAHPEIAVSGSNPIVIPYNLLAPGSAHSIEIRRADGSVYATIPNVTTAEATAERGSLPAGVTLDMTSPNPSGIVGADLSIATLRNTGSTEVSLLLTYSDYTPQAITIPAGGSAAVTIPAAKTGTAGNFAVVLSHESGFVRPIPYVVTPPVATLTNPSIVGTTRSFRGDALAISATSSGATAAEVRLVKADGTQIMAPRSVSLSSGANASVPVLDSGQARTLVTRSTPAFIEIRAQGGSWMRIADQITLLPPATGTGTATGRRAR